MAKKSPKFRCPHCGNVLEKSPIAKLLGDSGGFVGAGSPVSCPACGRPIDPQRMLNGEYDEPEGSGLLTLLALAVMLGGPFVLSLAFHWPLGWAIVTPWGVLLVVFGIIGGVMKLRGR
jgi:hypothetical protein